MKNAPSNLSNLKSKVDKLDIDKLVPVPVDLSKLSDVVKCDVVKKYVNDSMTKNIEDKIPDITDLATNAFLNAKINEVKGERPNITNLATSTALTAVENAGASLSNLVKNADYNTKFNEIEKNITDHNHGKYITTPDFNKFTAEFLVLKLKRSNLASKSDIANFVKKTDFDYQLKNVTSNKNELNELSAKAKAISTNKFSILNGAKYSSLEKFENYLVFIPAKKYIKYFTDTTRIEWWKSNGMPEESIENITKSDSNFAATFVDHHFLPEMNFNGHCLIKNNISIPKKVTNLYISYILGPQLRNLNTDFTLDNCLFGSAKLTKNADLYKYKYTGYGIGFDSRSEFLLTDGSYAKNVIIFGADMSSSVHVEYTGKDILILGEGRKQGLEDATLAAEARYLINFTQSKY